MQSVFVSRVSHASNDPRPPLTRTQSAVTDDPAPVAAKVYVVSALTDRINPYTMSDHEESVRPSSPDDEVPCIATPKRLRWAMVRAGWSEERQGVWLELGVTMAGARYLAAAAHVPLACLYLPDPSRWEMLRARVYAGPSRRITRDWRIG